MNEKSILLQFTCEVIVLPSCSVFPESKVNVLIGERGQGAVVLELLVTELGQLDQGLYLGHGDGDSSVTIRVGVGDGFLIAALDDNILQFWHLS